MSAERASTTFELPASGGTNHRCASCASRVCAQVESIPGVLRVECESAGPVRVEFDPERVTREELESEAHRAGSELDGIFAHAAWRVTGLDCPDCARSAEKAVAQVPSVVSAELNFASATLFVEYEPPADPRAQIVRAVEGTGHGIEPLAGAALQGTSTHSGPTWWTRNRVLVAVWGSGVATGYAIVAQQIAARLAAQGVGGAAVLDATASAACIVGVAFGWLLLGPRALSSLKTRSIDMNVLMLIAVTGALLLGDLVEAASVVFLYTLGGWLESRALARTRSSIRDLMELAPQRARVVADGGATEIPIDDVALGALVRVRAGERVPLDGDVVAGSSAVDEAAITGEPLPAAKEPGDRVFGGSLNTSGLLDVRVTAVAKDSTLARVVELVEQAQSAKAPVQLLVDRFSRVYTPAVVVLAVLVALVPPLLGVGGWTEWVTRALVLLVVACPCALVISTPVSLVSAISRAGRDGVLVKGGAYLEVAAKIGALAFDKTGTLTSGRPTVSDVIVFDDRVAPDEIVRLAALAEQHSNHPLAGAVMAAAAARAIDLSAHEATQVEEVPGVGVRAIVSGAAVGVSSAAYATDVFSITDAQKMQIAHSQAQSRSILVVSREGEALGYLGVEDPLRPEAPQTVANLGRLGIRHTVMLTGDNESTAAAVAARAGLSAHVAGLLPADKVDAVLRLKERYGTVAMLGDGINDAPALAAADLGIAMGAAGSDTALATADVALMADDLSALPGFFALGRHTLRIIKQNVAFSVVIKVAVLIAAVLGYANMWLAVFADTGVALLVILNGMRLLAPRADLGATGKGRSA